MTTLACAFVSTAAAQHVPPEIVRVRIGFDNLFKIGNWTPVEVTLKGGSDALTGRVEITVPDCDGVPSRVVTPPSRSIRLTKGQESSTLLYVRFGQSDSSIRIALRDQDSNRLHLNKFFNGTGELDPEHPATMLMTEQQLIVSVGPSVGLEDGRLAFSKAQRERIQVARLEGDDAVSRLPTRWYGYEGVSTLVLATNQPDMYRLLENNERLEALEQWVRLGGRLVLFAGASAPAILAGGEEGHPLARFMPGRFDKMVALTQLNAIEQYAETKHPVFPPGEAKPLSLPQLTGVVGKIEASEGSTPLVIRAPLGFGEVVFVAADLNVAPFSQWEGRRDFFRKLMNWKIEPEREEDPNGFGQSLTHLGFNDISGQLRAALDQFTGIRVVPFVAVALLVVVYILLIGPGDYFFVKKVLKRMEWTWVTFPIIVVLFSALAYTLARWSKGTQVQMNQVDLVDIDVQSRLVRGTTWANLFSPGTQSYRLSLRPQLPDDEETSAAAPISWMGLPGDGLGGMSNSSSPSLFQQPYEFSSELDVMQDVPIPVWDTKRLLARYVAESELDLDADLTVQDEELAGVLTNTLDVPLTDCLLAYGRYAYTLRTIEPGKTVELGRATERSDLQTHLTGRRLDYDEKKKTYMQSATPYDQRTHDVPAILRQMMFYEAGGGANYAGLTHDYQRFVDLSNHLQTGRAILIGFTLQPGDNAQPSAAAAVLQNDGTAIERATPRADRPDKHWTCYRFVFPVKASN